MQVETSREAIIWARGETYVAPAWQGFGVWQRNASGFCEGLHLFNGDKLTEAGFVFSSEEKAIAFAEAAVMS